jgi:hypothetical protein
MKNKSTSFKLAISILALLLNMTSYASEHEATAAGVTETYIQGDCLISKVDPLDFFTIEYNEETGLTDATATAEVTWTTDSQTATLSGSVDGHLSCIDCGHDQLSESFTTPTWTLNSYVDVDENDDEAQTSAITKETQLKTAVKADLNSPTNIQAGNYKGSYVMTCAPNQPTNDDN